VNGEKYSFISWLVVGIMSIYILSSFVGQIPAADEIIFIRITDHLPDYSSHLTWFSLDGKTDPNHDGVIDPNTGRDDSPFYEAAYEVPIWHHPPYANYMAWPFVKLLYHEGTNDEIKQGVLNLRIIAWVMMTFCIISTTILVRRIAKNELIVLISLIPLGACYILFTEWGNNWFYHDIFMLTSLVVALLMRGTKYQKYYYIPLALMVGSKGIGFLFLLPFALENRKVLWCLTAWIPFIIMCYYATGDPFFRITHWIGMREIAAGIIYETDSATFSQIVMHNINKILKGMGNVWLFFTVMALPFGYSIYRAFIKKMSWFYPSLFIVSMVAGLCFSAAYYQMIPMMLIGVLLVASVLKSIGEQRVIDKVRLTYAQISAR